MVLSSIIYIELLIWILLQGDSGGPLISLASEKGNYYHIIGVASFNSQCEVGEAPDVFTRVTGIYNYIF